MTSPAPAPKTPSRAKSDWTRYETPQRNPNIPHTTTSEMRERDKNRKPDEVAEVVIPDQKSTSARKRHHYQYRFRNDYTNASNQKDIEHTQPHLKTKEAVKPETYNRRYEVEPQIYEDFKKDQDQCYAHIEDMIHRERENIAHNTRVAAQHADAVHMQ